MKKIASIVVTLALAMSFTTVNAACWSKREYRDIENFSELDGKLILSFKDAVSCEALDGVSVKLGRLEYKTDLNGYLELPMTPFIEAENLDMPMLIKKPGYTSIKTELKVVAGTILNKRLLLSPSLAGNSMRFILQWSDEPSDLDLHLEGEGFHVSYRNMKSAGQAKLDQDEQAGFGPETITLREVQQHQRYKVSVVNYSGDGRINESAKVLVYAGDRLERVIPLNETNERKVSVLEVSQAEIHSLQKPVTDQKSLIPGW